MEGCSGVGGNAEEEVAVAEVVIGQADFSDPKRMATWETGAEVGLDDWGGRFEG